MRYRARLKAELAVIHQLGMASYFALLADLVADARQRGIATYGGLNDFSAASLTCFSLGVTEIDPIDHELPFEVFINHRRSGKAPTLSLAVCARRQHEVFDLLVGRHDADSVALARFEGDRARAALKAAASELGALDVRCPPSVAITALSSTRAPIGPPDRRVWDMLAAGDTEYVFGLESHLRDALRRIRPTSLTDLAIVQAIWRPGPLSAGLVDMFIEAKRRHAVPPKLHPLSVATRRTYGVPVFREQLLHTISAFSGIDLAEADLLRRDVSKHMQGYTAYWEARFVDGAARRGVDRHTSETTFRDIVRWSSHLASGACPLARATLSLRMATLKAHAPDEFSRVIHEAYGAA